MSGCPGGFSKRVSGCVDVWLSSHSKNHDTRFYGDVVGLWSCYDDEHYYVRKVENGCIDHEQYFEIVWLYPAAKSSLTECKVQDHDRNTLSFIYYLIIYTLFNQIILL